MKAPHLMRAAASCLVALLAAACGSVIVDKSSSNASASGSAAGVGGAGTTGASSSSGGDVGGGLGIGGFPAMSSSDVGTGGSPAMPGLFDCFGCLCDGSINYCELLTGGGTTPPPGPPPEPMCDAVPGPTRCKPLPAACLPVATCQCVISEQGNCTCEVDHAGIIVKCVLP